MANIRDPLHGFITLSTDEKKLISTEPFQRLRRIKQLGTTYLIYPSAEHNRFAHSLGVMEVATHVFDEIIKRDHHVLQWSEDEIKRNRQLLRLAALLHDIGHAPFSHVSDDLFADEIGSHEEMSARLILNSELTPIITRIGKDYEFSPAEVAGLITGKFKSEYKLLFQIFSSELDADKMDYLLRDSHFAGVQYGLYDFHRVVQNLTVHSQGGIWELAVDIGGLHAVEAFVLARYFMFTQVYLHKTRRIYDKIMVEFLRSILPNGKLPADPVDFLKWDDIYVLQKSKEEQNENVWAERLIHRKHLKLVREVFPHASKEDRDILKKIKEEIEKEFTRSSVYVDEYTQKPVIFQNEDGEPTIQIIDKRREQRAVPFYEKSKIIERLNEPIYIYRIYADDDTFRDVDSYFMRRFRYLSGRDF